MSSSYSLLLPCLSLACCILPCHHPHCIIMFFELAFVPVSSFSLLSVLSPDTLARARGMSEIAFYKWPEKCSRNGLKVGVRSYYSVDRPPAKFHRIRSSFDSPADNYSGSIAGLTSDIFGLRKQSPGLSLFSLLILRPSAQSTTYRQAQPNLSRQPAARRARVRKLPRTRTRLLSPLDPEHPQTSTKYLHFLNWAP